MPNWTKNYTIFAGSPDTIETIATACMAPNQQFDFDQLRPTPPLLEKLNAHNKMIDTDRYRAIFGDVYKDLYLPMPTSLDEFEHFIDTVNPECVTYNDESYSPLDYIPDNIYKQLQDTYGATDWYDWRVNNWGTKWIGSELVIDYIGNTLLVVHYNTAWDTPRDLFNYLLKTYPDLYIINGADHEDEDGLDINFGSPDSFYCYYTVEESATVAIDPNPEYSFTYRTQICTVNLHNINRLEEKGYFVDDECFFKPAPEK